METVKLYYENARLASFCAVVQECRAAKNGWEVALDQTAFYPEGGGQPSDLGSLNAIAVLDVQEAEGVVWHRVEKPLLPGETVQGQVDLARRLDYMQQHSADHILTGVIHNRYGFDNVGFHMGKESTFIDLSGTLEDSELAEMERVANEVIWMNLSIAASFPTEEALEKLNYRSKKELHGAVRIVTIPGVDVCACCGLHMESTGAVGCIKILSRTKLRGGVRIEYVAGRRAYAYFAALQGQNRRISEDLSAKPLETAKAVARLLEERNGLQSQVFALQNEHFAHLAARWRDQGNLLVFQEKMSADSLRRLADAVKETCGGVVGIFAGSDEAGYQYAIAVKEGDLRTLVKEMNVALSGRGGGREANFLQGSVKAARAEIKAFFPAYFQAE